jgi:hypothetical protein
MPLDKFDSEERAGGLSVWVGGKFGLGEMTTERVLTTPLDLPPGPTFAGLVTTERISHWIALARYQVLQEWRSSVANRVLNPITPEDSASVMAPVRWLLELRAPPGNPSKLEAAH